MGIFIAFILPALLVVIACRVFLHETVTIKESGLHFAAALLFGGLCAILSVNYQVHDAQMINGYVVSKNRDTVSCSHSYSCFCTTNKDGFTTCQTCYSHSEDYDWVVETSVGRVWINRVDYQGYDEPRRWTEVVLGEPVALPDQYVNYIKAAPESLFGKRTELGFADILPQYPEVHDYYRANRVLATMVVDPSLIQQFNHQIGMSLRTLGSEKQVNIVVVLTDQDPKFADALRSHWLGGKKNDVIVVIGTEDALSVEWARVFSWAKSDTVNVVLRDALLENKTIDPIATTALITGVIAQHFERRPMADFEYLKEEISPPTWLFLLCMGLNLIASIGLGYVFHRERIA